MIEIVLQEKENGNPCHVLRSILPRNRPGYGLSDFLPERRLLDWPQDVSEFADALGIERKYIYGREKRVIFYLCRVKASRISALCSAGLTFSKTLITLPSAPTRKVVRSTPSYGLPMSFFSPQTPYRSHTL